MHSMVPRVCAQSTHVRFTPPLRAWEVELAALRSDPVSQSGCAPAVSCWARLCRQVIVCNWKLRSTNQAN